MTPGDGRGVEIQKWANELQDLLAEGVRALRSGDVGKVADVQRKLRVFKERSPDYADSLDRVATLAILDLDLQATEMAVERIEQRSEEVDRLAKLIRGHLRMGGQQQGPHTRRQRCSRRSAAEVPRVVTIGVVVRGILEILVVAGRASSVSGGDGGKASAAGGQEIQGPAVLAVVGPIVPVRAGSHGDGRRQRGGV